MTNNLPCVQNIFHNLLISRQKVSKFIGTLEQIRFIILRFTRKYLLLCEKIIALAIKRLK